MLTDKAAATMDFFKKYKKPLTVLAGAVPALVIGAPFSAARIVSELIYAGCVGWPTLKEESPVMPSIKRVVVSALISSLAAMLCHMVEARMDHVDRENEAWERLEDRAKTEAFNKAGKGNLKLGEPVEAREGDLCVSATPIKLPTLIECGHALFSRSCPKSKENPDMKYKGTFFDYYGEPFYICFPDGSPVSATPLDPPHPL